MKDNEHPAKSYVETEMVRKISERTGVSKVKVHRILSVFRIAFKKYLKTQMKLPLQIESVFKIYKGKSKANRLKTEEQIKNWRKLDDDAPYKKQ